MAERGATIPRERLDEVFDNKGPKQYALWIDLEFCVGCNACTMACKAENNTPLGVDYTKVIEIEEGEFTDPKKPPQVRVYFLPMACMHCAKPACLAACPVGAITKRQEDGIVLINKDKCIGCRYCAWACPYGAPVYNAEAKVMEKCTLCVHRTSKGLLPACVTTCISRTRHFGDVNLLTGTIKEKRARRIQLGDSQTQPSVAYTK
ncbi:MAG: 4Fe-4S dicluster domain-containing protein [Armatimonadetes bacterium]|nr:4Fe-4S dicluster domain-containing protein [Armatimonadota bacterium]